MIRHICDQPVVKCSILTWENTQGDVDELITMGVQFIVDGDDLILRDHRYDGDMLVTRTLIAELGDRVTFTPVGWMAYEPGHEDLFAMDDLP